MRKHVAARLFENRIFQQMREKPTKFNVFATILMECTGRIVSSRLAGASSHIVAGSWSDLSRSAWKRSVF